MTIELRSVDKIKNLYSDAVFRRGQTYYKQGRVFGLQYVSSEEIWNAKVFGSEIYDVDVEVSENDFYANCTCPAYENYGECKHEVAVLLQILNGENDSNHSGNEIKSIQENITKNIQAEKANRLISIFSDLHQSLVDSNQITTKKVMQVEYIIKIDYNDFYLEDSLLKLELKVGVERTYVIRDIREFLKKVRNQIPHEFTKKFTYDPHEHYFADEDREIIELLQQIIKNESIYKEPTPLYWYGSTSKDRDLTIPPFLGEILLSKLKNVNSCIEDNGFAYHHIDIRNDQLPLSFQLNKDEDGEFQLAIEELHNIVYLEQYGGIFHQGFFYKPTTEQMLLIKELLQFEVIDDMQSFQINPDQISPFLSNVLPGLKKLGQVEISEKVSDQIVQPPLKAKVFIDGNEEMVNVKLEYHYDELVINPFGEDEQNIEVNRIILLRDTEKEREIMSIIEYSPLKYKGKQLYLDVNDDNLYEFIFTIIPKLEDVAEIYMASGIQSFFRSNSYSLVTSIDLESNGNLLDVNFNIEGIDKKEVEQILKSVVEKKRYYRLENGSFISLENDEFENIQQLFSELNITTKQMNHNNIQVPIYRGLQVDEIIKQGNKYSTKLGKAFKNLVHNLKNPEDIDFELPTNLRASLRDYQKTGFGWFKALAFYRLGGILADDMGLGKTLQSISYLLSEKQTEMAKQPFLIVAPASLVYNWKSEFEKFSPGIQAEVVIGSPKERLDILQRPERPDVWITSYPTLRQDIEFYSEVEFGTVILDEAQAIKNHGTKTAAAVRKIKAGRKFALSGTPIENSLDELWSIFQTIMPGFFPSQQEFRKLSNEKIAKMVGPFILRRVKKDVLKELPDKIESNHLSELTKSQKELYLAYLEKIQKDTVQSIAGEGFNKNRLKILAGLTRLRQLCCHPSLFIENYNGESGKLEELMEITCNAVDYGKRLLIFSQFSSMLQIIRDRMQKEGISCFYLDGQTPSKERVEMTNRFNDGENEVFLISLKAGGTGLNLTGADTVILYDLWWNPAVEEQAAGRAHRIGQKKVVQVIRLIARGTIEEKIYELQQKKKELIEQVIQPGETMLTSLSENEIREILSI